MPFVMMCGLPSSGKTYYANKLADHLRNTMNKNVIRVNESPFMKEKNAAYLGIIEENTFKQKIVLKGIASNGIL